MEHAPPTMVAASFASHALSLFFLQKGRRVYLFLFSDAVVVAQQPESSGSKLTLRRAPKDDGRMIVVDTVVLNGKKSVICLRETNSSSIANPFFPDRAVSMHQHQRRRTPCFQAERNAVSVLERRRAANLAQPYPSRVE